MAARTLFGVSSFTAIEEFKKLEKIYEEETESAIRGGHSVGYDEN
jgi:hypothetical protein